MKEKLKFVSNNLKWARTRAGLSQEEAAQKINVSRATYCDYEVNPQKVKIETLMKLSILYKCSLKEFFLENDVTYRDEN